MSRTLVFELKEQFRRQWEMLRELVEGVPDEHWRAGDLRHLVPAGLVYHILSGAEVYARETTYEQYKARQKLPLDWQVTPPAELPDKPTTLRYIREMEEAATVWLETLGDDGLLAPDPGFPWTGSTKIGRAVYLLRHTQNHIGEVNAELRRRGIERGKWR